LSALEGFWYENGACAGLWPAQRQGLGLAGLPRNGGVSVAGRVGFIVLSVVYLCPGSIVGADEMEEARAIAAVVAAEKRLASKASAGDRQATLLPEEERLPIFFEQEPETFLGYLKKRTRLGVGFEQEHNNNVFLEDNKADEEYITTLESLITFVDPRGPLTLGGSYEINAFRHNRRRKAAIDHDLKAYFEYDTGRRILYKLDYHLDAVNRLVLAPALDDDDPVKFDVIRRSNDFQRQVKHEWVSTLDYALDEEDVLTSKTRFELFDDQVADDEGTDRRTIETKLDLARQLREKLKLTAGYTFTDTTILNKRTSSTRKHSGAIRGDYDLNELFSVNGGVTLSKIFSKQTTSQPAEDFAPFGGWTLNYNPARALTPKATLNFAYSDSTQNTFANVDGAVLVRIRRPSVKLDYEMSPKISLSVDWAKELWKREVISGGTTPSTIRLYTLSALVKWQSTEQGSFDLSYKRTRNGTDDTTQGVVTLGFETTF
jgi:hypothetical protein